jgi:AraC-like DNA-binding protein
MKDATLLELTISQIDRNLGPEGEYYAPFPNLVLLRHFAPTEFEAVVYEPVVCLILQGSKETILDNRSFRVDRGQSLIISHDLSVGARITDASVQCPYVAIVLKLDLATLRNLYESADVYDSNRGAADSIAVDRLDDATVDALRRYVMLVDVPGDTRVLGPLIVRELHYRLLMAPHGGMLRRLMLRNSHASNIFRAIKDIRENFKAPLAIPAVAKDAGMGISSFHTHFKAITGTTPLQYQKDLRLMEAKQILMAGRHSVSSAAFEVGYESPTQFSREYKRKFGRSPANDLIATGRPGLPVVQSSNYPEIAN